LWLTPASAITKQRAPPPICRPAIANAVISSTGGTRA
jgi:hypothetical protein